MASELATTTMDFAAIEAAVFNNDIAKLNPAQRAEFLGRMAVTSGLNPLTQPFQIIKLNGKDTVYATKGAAQQLAMKNGISIKVTKLEVVDDCIECHVEGQIGNRIDSEVALVPYTKSMGAADKCNAKMKVLTKAKRRLVLSMCGLGMLDEAEFDTIPEKAFTDGKPELKDVTPNPAVITPSELRRAGFGAVDGGPEQLNIKSRLAAAWKQYLEGKPKADANGEVIDHKANFYAHVSTNSYGGDWVPSDKLTPEQTVLLHAWLTTQGV